MVNPNISHRFENVPSQRELIVNAEIFLVYASKRDKG